MKAATAAIQRPADARLLVVDCRGRVCHARQSDFVDVLRPSDVVIANDAATLPASLSGRHIRTGRRIEVRLAGRRTLAASAVREFVAIAFGDGDFRTPTEDRPAPPLLIAGDELHLGPLRATIARVLGHPRLVSLAFDGHSRQIWEGLARYGRPIQYSHLQEPLAIWDTWTSIAGPPVAFEPPSAGFALDWSAVAALNARGVHFATITHAAGISSTGDAELDSLLPFDEPYRIPRSTALLLRTARATGGRVIAVGTSVVRALEHAASRQGFVQEGEGLATQKIGPSTRLRVVDAVLSGTHEPGSSHYELLGAFAAARTLARMTAELESEGYRTHEFGDSVFLERSHKRTQGCDLAFDLAAPAPQAEARC
jgi:S-adenosylmethionine:tRNA ribosyltransferase-isomerase